VTVRDNGFYRRAKSTGKERRAETKQSPSEAKSGTRNADTAIKKMGRVYNVTTATW